MDLPTIIRFKNHKCACLVDVDDKDRRAFSVFDLKELWQALSDVVKLCWLGERHNGRGYPGSQTAWAGFVESVGTESGALKNTSLLQGINVLDLSEDGTKSVVKSSS